MSLNQSIKFINLRSDKPLILDNYPSSEQIISSSKDSTGVFSVNYNNANTVIASYLSNNSYTIFLTDYINDNLRGKKSNNGIEIFPSSFGVSVNRGIVKGINSSTPPKLILTYTKYQ